jgi:hypothetical protein
MSHGASGWPFRAEALTALALELPLRALITLAIAVFALFSVLGPVIDLLGGAQEPIATILRMSLLSGFVSLGYAYSGIRRNYWIGAIALLFQFVWLALESHLAPAGSAVPVLPSKPRLAADGVLVLLQIIVSYSFFLIFINNTARRYLLIRAEVELARQIHQVLVPAVGRRVGAFEFLGFSHPSGEVGGDLVDVVTSEPADTSPGWFGYVADVSGHGVSSGLVMGMFKSALRMRLRQPGGLADLLGDLNSVLLPLKNPQHVRDGRLRRVRRPSQPRKTRQHRRQ